MVTRMGREALLQITDLKTSFLSETGPVAAVDGLTLEIGRGETIGLVGESGCGKTVTVLSIMRLVPKPGGQIDGGRIVFEGRDLLECDEAGMRKIRGNQISMIFQEPMTSLNPVYTVGNQICEVLSLHQGKQGKEAVDEAIELLRLVGIPHPERRVKDYPHNLSGGMRQRVMIAMALACRPKLLIADEPTTALDVTIQAQILELLKKLRDELGMAILLITHALGVVAEMADRVIVMYAGKIVEEAPVRDLFREPLHPYTVGLLESIPRLDSGKKRLHVIDGVVPSLKELPSGCRFNPRCPHATEVCRAKEPPLNDLGGGRRVSCWHKIDHWGVTQ